MEKEILVAYATTSGSTQEVAENIANTLKEKGLVVDTLPIKQVKTLEGYRHVVLGAPLYMFRWHADAHRFLIKYRSTLDGKIPVAIFAGGPTEKGDEEEYKEVREQLDKELSKYPWLKPASIKIVGGKLDPATLKFPYNMIPALRQMPPRDFRDWKAIRAWAIELSDRFNGRHS
ncbi:MAG: flavodoxin domain-containing protein [Anaerolineaceae bacterium]